jgi:CRISPR system Cascade subunit CasE
VYLSRLWLDPRHRDTRAWLADCHKLHRTIMSAFGQAGSTAAREEFGVLYRVEADGAGPAVHVIVQSAAAPLWALESRAVLRQEGPRPLDQLEAAIVPGARFRFRLRANPTRRVHQRATQGPDLRELGYDGEWHEPGQLAHGQSTGVVRRREAEQPQWKGKRVELHREEDRLAWLARRGREQAGFSLEQVRLEPAGRDVPGTRGDPAGRIIGNSLRLDRRMTFGTCLFEGTLRVTDRDPFIEALARGIGPGKAFGCGLLSIAPAGGR